jgi:hypothetical protein
MRDSRLSNILGLWAVVLSAGVFLIPILSMRQVASAQGLPTHTPTVTTTASPTVTLTATPTQTLSAQMAAMGTAVKLARATVTPTPEATIPAELISVTFINLTERDVCFLYISPVESDQWGDDWLGAGTVLYPGESIVIDDVEERGYDLMAEDCENEEVWSASGIGLADGQEIEIVDQ